MAKDERKALMLASDVATLLRVRSGGGGMTTIQPPRLISRTMAGRIGAVRAYVEE